MSADNWGICPKCMAKAVRDKDNLKLKIDNSYAKIPAEKYLELFNKWKEPIAIKNTLREDYELGVDADGIFYVDYSCACTTCTFKHLFNDNQQLKVE